MVQRLKSSPVRPSARSYLLPPRSFSRDEYQADTRPRLETQRPKRVQDNGIKDKRDGAHVEQSFPAPCCSSEFQPLLGPILGREGPSCLTWRGASPIRHSDPWSPDAWLPHNSLSPLSLPARRVVEQPDEGGNKRQAVYSAAGCPARKERALRASLLKLFQRKSGADISQLAPDRDHSHPEKAHHPALEAQQQLYRPTSPCTAWPPVQLMRTWKESWTTEKKLPSWRHTEVKRRGTKQAQSSRWRRGTLARTWSQTTGMYVAASR